MDAFNRNIITGSDIATLLDRDLGTPKTLDVAPPAGYQLFPAPAPAPAPVAGAAASAPAAAPSGVTAPTADGYLTKLLKYVPLEVLGIYLFVERLVVTNVKDEDQLEAWLFWTLVITVVLTAVYMRTVLNVVRFAQVSMGAIGIAVYVFSTGGWFATMAWYQKWYSSIALVVFGVLVAVIKLPSLPAEAP